MSSSSKTPGKGREWTQTELEKLFKEYFDRSPGFCPVFGAEVRMMMESAQASVTLKMQCPVCRNAGQVTRNGLGHG